MSAETAQAGGLLDELDRIFAERREDLECQQSERLWTADHIKEAYPDCSAAELSRLRDDAYEAAGRTTARIIELYKILGMFHGRTAGLRPGAAD